LGWWASAILLLTAADLLLAMRGYIPDWVSIVLANTAGVLAAGVLYHALRRFYGLPNQLFIALLPAAIIGVTFSFIHNGGGAEAYYALRVVLAVGSVAVLLGACAWIILSRRPLTPNEVLTGGACAMLFALGLLRIILAGAGLEPPLGLFVDNTATAAWLGLVAVLVAVLSMGFLLMVTDRIRDGYVHLATHDALTGITNRSAFIAAAEHVLKRARRDGRCVTLMLADLDRFKTINDTYGHAVGDRVLQTFVETARDQIRDGDIFARHGGEEFVFLLPETELQAARGVAERIRAATAAIDIRDVRGKPIRLTVSIGIASEIPSPGKATALDPLLRRADRAMYAAKSGGRNLVVTEGPRDAAMDNEGADRISPESGEAS
jgi:diguanylate cyclase (GGDEF)-like protein